MSMPNCLVCDRQISMELRKNERNGRPFLMLVCPVDGAHFRAFINEREYVAQIVKRLEKTRS